MSVLRLIVLIGLLQATSGSNRGFILTAPKHLLAESVEAICISLHNTIGPANISLDLLHSDSDDKIATTQHQTARENECLELVVPSTTETQGRLHLQVRFDEMLDYTINSVQEIIIVQHAVVTIIQTDRPVYKPGQLVQFRVLSLNRDLKAITEPLEKVTLESPGLFRMAQWLNVKTRQGLVHLDFQLSTEPIQGFWKIYVERNNTRVKKAVFEVREYVLPRFEVTIKPPEFILARSDSITWNICAKYTFGQPVKGRVHIKAHLEFPSWIIKCNRTDSGGPYLETGLPKLSGTYYSRCVDVPMEINLNLPFDGCSMFNVTGTEFGLNQQWIDGKSPNSVFVTAIVTEANTGIERNATSETVIRYRALTVNFEPHSPRYFKPGIPYSGKLLVLRPSSRPASNIFVQICVSQRSEYIYGIQAPLACHNFTSDGHGFVNFTLPMLTVDADKFYFTATPIKLKTQFYDKNLRLNVKMTQPTAYLEIEPWYSPSNSFIEISDNVGSPRCNYHHTFHVQFIKHPNESTPIFNFLVMARGDLVLSGRVHPTSVVRLPESDNIITLNRTLPDEPPLETVEHFGFKLLITPKMSPVSRLLLYYVRADGETVAATYRVDIAPCFANKVSAGWQQQRQSPGAATVLHIAAAPHSLCGVTTVDKSTSLLRAVATVDIDTVFEQLKRFQIDEFSQPHQFTNVNYCIEDTSTVVPSEGIVADDDLRRRRRRYSPSWYEPSNKVDAVRAFNDFGVVVMTDLTVKTSPCVRIPNGMFGLGRYGGGRSMMFNSQDFDSIPAMAMGGFYPHEQPAFVTVRSFFPETWLWELVDTGRQGRAQVRRNLPHTVTEWVGGVVCLSPQQGLGISPPMQITAYQPFFVELVLPYAVKRQEVMMIKVALYSFLSHSVPARLTFEPSPGIELLSEESSASHCVESQGNWVHHFRIRATELGEINITVSAEVDSSFPAQCGPDTLISRRDVLVKPLLVKPEGFPVEITKSALICYKEDDSTEERTLSWDLQLPSDVVEGSARAEVNMVGDLMGPTLQNLGSLVQMPMGCGEQNMILFVPNLNVVNYLAATRQPNPKLQAEAIKNMEKGYQRELNYRHEDGSYSAFGKTDPEGSMWLTAFVVKTFAQARAHIFIDEHDLLVSLKWISDHQLENGCFPMVGQVFHRDMRGGLTDDGQSSALTAYVLISLLETGLPLPAKLSENAKFCLVADTGNNVYTRALTTYALTLLGDKELMEDSLQRLIALAIVEQDMLHWEKTGSESHALSVEMTAYGILALVKVGGEDNMVMAYKAVRWISQHRNAHGGFVSTQDTVVALEALSKYSASIPIDKTNLNILVTAATVENSFQIRYHDRMLLKRQPLPQLPTHVEVVAHGEGCALVQNWLRYNVHTITGDAALELEEKVMSVASVDRCSRQRLEFCVRYKPRDQTSNMAVLEVVMVSGYVPDKDSLSQLDNSIDVKRWEVEKDQVNFYFDSLSNRQLCLSFVVEQQTEVENPLPANARLYDYYQPELTISKNYQVANTCDIEPLPQPMPRSGEHDNEAVDSLDLPSVLPSVDETGTNSLMVQSGPSDPNSLFGPSDPNNLIRVSRPRGTKRRRNRTQIASTESYSALPSPSGETSPTDTPETTPPTSGTTDPVPTLDDLSTGGDSISLSTSPNETVTNTSPELNPQFVTVDHELEFPQGVEGPVPVLAKPSDYRAGKDTKRDTPPELNPQFVTVDHELEFPQGVEGPVPVLTKPSDYRAGNDDSCPFCWASFPPDFSSIYCNAAAVFKAIRRKADTVRLLLDLTVSKNMNRLRKIIKIDLSSDCVCHPLEQENATVLLVLKNSLDGINELKLNRDVNVWSIPAQLGQPEEVKLARADC